MAKGLYVMICNDEARCLPTKVADSRCHSREPTTVETCVETCVETRVESLVEDLAMQPAITIRILHEDEIPLNSINRSAHTRKALQTNTINLRMIELGQLRMGDCNRWNRGALHLQ